MKVHIMCNTYIYITNFSVIVDKIFLDPPVACTAIIQPCTIGRGEQECCKQGKWDMECKQPNQNNADGSTNDMDTLICLSKGNISVIHIVIFA